jgi:hypothetical protein
VSFKALVVPEDPTYNGYILGPLVTRIMRECGKPNAKVTVLSNPKTSGYEDAKRLLVDRILEAYSHFDLILFLPDADGKDKSAEFALLETGAVGFGVRLFCCAAIPEIEVWLLAGHLAKLDRPWPEIRAEPDVKESVFEPFLAEYGDARRASGGRDLLMEETLRNYQGLTARCPELAELEARIRDIFDE